jgi:hypothetical protein
VCPQRTDSQSRESVLSSRRVRHKCGTHSAVFEVVEHDVEPLAFNAVVLDHNTRAPDNLARVTLPINLAKPSPSTEDLGIANFDHLNLVLSAKSLDEFDILRLRTFLNEDAQVGLAFI